MLIFSQISVVCAGRHRYPSYMVLLNTIGNKCPRWKESPGSEGGLINGLSLSQRSVMNCHGFLDKCADKNSVIAIKWMTYGGSLLLGFVVIMMKFKQSNIILNQWYNVRGFAIKWTTESSDIFIFNVIGSENFVAFVWLPCLIYCVEYMTDEGKADNLQPYCHHCISELPVAATGTFHIWTISVPSVGEKMVP